MELALVLLLLLESIVILFQLSHKIGGNGGASGALVAWLRMS